MKTPKRKAPEKKPAGRIAGPVLGVGAAAFGAAAARPGLTGGLVVFAIIFGMISANALWYQPGGHPSPLLRTRDAADPHLLVGFQRSEEPADVTTFRIERAPAATAPADVEGVLRDAASDLVLGVQQELARLGHYQGPADGRPGPLTAAAIVAFQKSAGLPETGEASDRLLATLKAAKPPAQTPAPLAAATPKADPKPAASAVIPKPVSKVAAVPAARPTVVSAREESIDPVAEAIRNAGKPTPPAPLSGPVRAQPVAVKPAGADSTLVLKIQRGLSKFAYSHIVVDGVAGETTREAILNFERAYRLPETGEPNERVLKKLKEIGAL